MSISIKHLHPVIRFEQKQVPLPNFIDRTDTIITLSRRESTIRFTYRERSFCITVNNALLQCHSYTEGSQMMEHKQEKIYMLRDVFVSMLV